MLLLSLQGITLDLGAKALFSELSCSISLGDRIGLVGLNGSGKSTLLKMLCGELEPDSGKIWRHPNLHIEHVSQFLPDSWRNKSLFDIVAENLPDGYAGKCSDYQVESVIETVRLPESLYFSPLRSLSGGEINRALLARALVRQPDVLLLDEPTNHLDVAMIKEFEEVIRELDSKAICLISHDRELLDHLTHKTYFLRERRITALPAPYTKARTLLEKADADRLRRRDAEEREIERVRASAKRLSEWGKVYDNEKFAKRAKSMEKRLTRMEEKLSSLPERSRAKVEMLSSEASAPTVLSIEAGKVLSPQGRCLFEFPNIRIRAGERMLLQGANGCGKSTFLRQMVAQLQLCCTNTPFTCHASGNFGYYDQELREFNFECTVFETIRRGAEIRDQEIINELVRAGFPYARQHTKIKVLSGGERARLKLLLLKLARPTLLFLDEPTNHLDVEGIEQLELALIENNTSCLFVSHDRRFAENVATNRAVIEEACFRVLPIEPASAPAEKLW